MPTQTGLLGSHRPLHDSRSCAAAGLARRFRAAPTRLARRCARRVAWCATAGALAAPRVGACAPRSGARPPARNRRQRGVSSLLLLLRRRRRRRAAAALRLGRRRLLCVAVFAHRAQQRVGAQPVQVGAAHAFGAPRRHRLQVDAVGHRQAARQRAQHAQALRRPLGRAEVPGRAKRARPQRLVQKVGAVRRREHEELALLRRPRAVNRAQAARRRRVRTAPASSTAAPTARRRERVDLVEEDDAPCGAVAASAPSRRPRGRGARRLADVRGEGARQQPLTERNASAHCDATAFAISVLPLPGGPYSSTPDRVRIPSPKRCGAFSGSSTVSKIAAFASACPPTSSPHVRDRDRAARRLRLRRAPLQRLDSVFLQQLVVVGAASARATRGALGGVERRRRRRRRRDDPCGAAPPPPRAPRKRVRPCAHTQDSHSARRARGVAAKIFGAAAHSSPSAPCARPAAWNRAARPRGQYVPPARPPAAAPSRARLLSRARAVRRPAALGHAFAAANAPSQRRAPPPAPPPPPPSSSSASTASAAVSAAVSLAAIARSSARAVSST